MAYMWAISWTKHKPIHTGQKASNSPQKYCLFNTYLHCKYHRYRNIDDDANWDCHVLLNSRTHT